jgi:hypothetical protein
MSLVATVTTGASIAERSNTRASLVQSRSAERLYACAFPARRLPPQPERDEHNPTPTDGPSRQRPSAVDRRPLRDEPQPRAPLASA